MDFLYSHQPTSLVANNLVSNSDLFDVDIDYLHAGGSQIWKGENLDHFFGGGLGVSRLSPVQSAYSAKTRFSLSIAGGTVYKFSKHVGLRFELRGYFTYLGSDDEVFCQGENCPVEAVSVFQQFEANMGLRFQF